MWGPAKRALAVLLLALAVGCGTTGAPSTAQDPPSLAAQEFKLGVGDELRIVVFGQTELTGQFQVGAQGNVVYPLIGDIQAAGLTVSEFTDALKARLQQGYVLNPNVSVEVTKYRPFYILGEVETPGTYPFSPSLTVMRAVATAGGFTYRANSRRVFILHENEREEHEYPLTSTIPVQPGDTVRIPERRF